MKLIYELEGAGWANARIADGSRHRDFSVSFLSDALGDMATAAVTLLKGSHEASFSFQDEPGEHRFVLSRDERNFLTIRVLWFDQTFSGHAELSGEEVFRCECAVLDFVGQVYANLHSILTEFGLDGYQRAWRSHAFPVRAYDEIQRRLNPPNEAKRA